MYDYDLDFADECETGGAVDNFWLLDFAESLLSDSTTKTVELARCIKDLKVAINSTKDGDLERRFRAVRSRLFTELNRRNEWWAKTVFGDCAKHLAEADETLAIVTRDTGAIRAFDRLNELLRTLGQGIGILRTKRYLIPFVTPRLGELVVLEERMANLATKCDELRPQVLAAHERKLAAEQAAQIAAENAKQAAELRAKEECVERIRRLYTDCGDNIANGNLAAARRHLDVLLKEEVEFCFVVDEDGIRRPQLVPKPEVAQLEQKYAVKVAERVSVLKDHVVQCSLSGDQQGLLLALAQIDQMDALGLAKAFGSVEQARMFSRRFQQRAKPVGKAGIRVLR